MDKFNVGFIMLSILFLVSWSIVVWRERMSRLEIAVVVYVILSLTLMATGHFELLQDGR